MLAMLFLFSPSNNEFVVARAPVGSESAFFDEVSILSVFTGATDANPVWESLVFGPSFNLAFALSVEVILLRSSSRETFLTHASVLVWSAMTVVDP